jgi:hypothetical protein
MGSRLPRMDQLTGGFPMNALPFAAILLSAAFTVYLNLPLALLRPIDPQLYSMYMGQEDRFRR